MQRIQSFQLGGLEKLIVADDPRHALWENGGLSDHWYLDDGDVLCRPVLVRPCKRLVQPTLKLEQNGTDRKQKSSTTLQTWTQRAALLEWNINDVRP